MSHTPGPWTYNEYREIRAKNPYHGESIAKIMAMSHEDETLANSRLIAMAPEMFEFIRNAKILKFQRKKTMNHTPGPWIYDGYGSIQSKNSSCGGTIAKLEVMSNENEMHTNGQLIAMAPEMFEFVEQSTCRCYDEYNQRLRFDCDRCRILKSLRKVNKLKEGLPHVQGKE